MSLKKWLKNFKKKTLPPSTHRMEHIENNLILNMNKILSECISINKKIQNFEKRNDMLFWFLQMEKGDSLYQTKKKFFAKIGKEKGFFRNVQLIILNFLDVIDEICTANGLTYFLWGGTLLGAVRHQGFVPWDEDADIGMMREDFLKLREILKKQNRYELVDYYEVGCRRASCGRFAKLRDTELPLQIYLDIFIFDWENTDSDADAIQQYYSRREPLRDRIWTMAKTLGCSAESRPIEDRDIKSHIDAIFDEYIYPYATEGTAIQWGLDLFQAPFIRCWKKEYMFPVIRLPFERDVLDEDMKPRQRSFCVPQQPELVCTLLYGDWMNLPNDCYSNFHSNYFDFFGKDENIKSYLKTRGCSDSQERT